MARTVRVEIAVDLGLAAQFDAARRVDVALDLPVDENIIDLDLGLDQGLLADGQRAPLRFNGPFEAAMQLQFAGKRERALNSLSAVKTVVLRAVAGGPLRAVSAGSGGRLVESRNVDISFF